MTVGVLLANYKGDVEFYDYYKQEFVGKTFGGSPIIDAISDKDVFGWSAKQSAKNPCILVYCAFTPAPEPEPEVPVTNNEEE